MIRTQFRKKLVLLILSISGLVLSNAQEDSIAYLDLLFVGDIMQHQPQIAAAEIIANKSYDYESCFKYVRPIIKKADLAIGNLEVTLPGKPPYQGYPQFRSPDDLAFGLRQAGFDMMVTANNHSNDAGRGGLISTIQTLKSYGFYQTGTFKNALERNLFYPLILYKNDFKLGFLNYTYGTNGIKTRPPAIVNYIDTSQIKKDLDLVKLINPDFTIVFMHWGKEYELRESEEQQKLAKWLLHNGADVIIGAHPHVVQPIREYMDTVAGHKKLVVYSMGNFISNQTKANTDGGIMVSLRLAKHKPGQRTILEDHRFIPVWRYVRKEKNKKRKYYAIPVSAFENGREKYLNMEKSAIQSMQYFAKKTRDRLNQWQGKEQFVDLSTLKEIDENIEAAGN